MGVGDVSTRCNCERGYSGASCEIDCSQHCAANGGVYPFGCNEAVSSPFHFCGPTGGCRYEEDLASGGSWCAYKVVDVCDSIMCEAPDDCHLAGACVAGTCAEPVALPNGARCTSVPWGVCLHGSCNASLGQCSDGISPETEHGIFVACTFRASGDITDYADDRTRAAIKQAFASQAGVLVSAVALELSASSVTVEVTIAASTTQQAVSILYSLTTGMLSDSTALSLALGASGATGIVVEAILLPPTIILNGSMLNASHPLLSSPRTPMVPPHVGPSGAREALPTAAIVGACLGGLFLVLTMGWLVVRTCKLRRARSPSHPHSAAKAAWARRGSEAAACHASGRQTNGGDVPTAVPEERESTETRRWSWLSSLPNPMRSTSVERQSATRTSASRSQGNRTSARERRTSTTHTTAEGSESSGARHGRWALAPMLPC